MPIQLAANRIPYTNWAHLQLVYGNAEIEVQAPLGITIPVGGKWDYSSLTPIQLHSDTPNYGVADSYRITSLDIGVRTDVNVWDVMKKVHAQFSTLGQNIDYNIDQNSNSYANSLMYMLGLYTTAGTIRPVTATDGFPGLGTNVLLNDAVDFGFNLTLTAGRDLLNLGNQGDRVYGGAERDTVFGMQGEDTLYGDAGADSLDGGEGFDTLYGGADNDTILGGDGEDDIYGEAGVDSIKGGAGRDVIFGGDDGDFLYGEAGDDRLDGGAGNDVLEGGADADVYVLSAGSDVITDDGAKDVIASLSGTAVETETDSGIYKLGDATVTQSGGTVTITHANGTVQLTNYAKGDFGIVLEEKGDTPVKPPAPPISPVALDLSGNGEIDMYWYYQISNTNGITGIMENTTYFDLDNDGFKEKVQWIKPTDGWLVRDLNGDGKINNQNEMFGASDGQTAYQKLAALNTNNTGASLNALTSTDTAWNLLKVWQDGDSDGITDAGELKTLASLGITSISTVETSLGSLNSTFIRSGVTYKSQDIFLNISQLNSWWIGKDSEVLPAALSLPLSRGYGDVKSMHYAASENTTLMTKMTELKNLSITGLDGFYTKLETAVETWAGTSAVSSAGTNTLVDWSHKATMEKFTGTGAGSIPADSDVAGYNLEKNYSDFLEQMSVKFLAQGALKAVFGSPIYDFGTDRLRFSLTHTEILANAQANVPLDAADKAVYWSETARILLDYATDFGTTVTAMQTVINAAAGNAVTPKNLGGWIMEATSGNDVMIGTSAHDGHMVGGDGNDSLSGLAGNEVLLGGPGMDTLRGGTENDGLKGEAGDDVYRYARGDGDDWITDGQGTDTLILENIALGEVTFETSELHPLANNVANGQGGGGGLNSIKIVINGGGSIILSNSYSLMYSTNIDSVQFSGGVTLTAQEMKSRTALVGTDFANALWGDSLNNVMYGRGGADTLTAGAGNDSVFGEAGNDRLFGESGDDILSGGTENDELIGADGNDSLNGDGGDDKLWANLGNDTLNGGDGNDDVQGNEGNDVVAGGMGNDTIWGQDGDDVMNGGAGKDQITGGAGLDVFVFSAIADSQAATADYIWDFNPNGEKLDLQGLGFTGLDTDGGLTEAGELRFSVAGSVTTVTSDQTGFTFQINGALNSTNFTNADFIFGGSPPPPPPPTGNTIIGTAANDTLNGTAGADSITGLGGNDSLLGAAANDTLDGGLGRDTLNGGTGNDVFLFSNLTHTSRTGTGTDLITDFTDGQDKVSLVGLGFTGFDTDGGTTEAGELKKFYTASTNITTIASDQTGLFAFNITGNVLATFDNSDILF